MAGSGVELLFGPFLIGVILSAALYGVMAVQMLQYYQAHKKDSRWFRYLVLYLFFTESVNLLIEIGIIYEPLIIRYGTQQALIVSPLVLPGDSISIVMVSTPVQLFTAWRISVITEAIVLPLIISILSIVSFGGGLLVTVFASIRNEFREFQSFSGAVMMWLICSAVCDVLIAVVLAYSLMTRKTGFTPVDSQINRVIRLSLQTGAVTAFVALADLILFLGFPTTTLNFIPDFPLSKLYTISLLSTLNARARRSPEYTEQRLPNALFNESATRKTTVVDKTMGHLVLHHPPPYINVHVEQISSALGPSGGPSLHKNIPPDVPPKDMHYSFGSRAETTHTSSYKTPAMRF
ncbi:hypothetical protein MVEN_02549800 [Mycena venus]|uniref:DUF6534 domain-containing protein n=1 Tax=Mycena venus TaxID=2733690 RepID=A0A8H6U1V4_9AGAR|nr:hypothetical protein MVEN_02549800 [Mycena venus]